MAEPGYPEQERNRPVYEETRQELQAWTETLTQHSNEVLLEIHSQEIQITAQSFDREGFPPLSIAMHEPSTEVTGLHTYIDIWPERATVTESIAAIGKSEEELELVEDMVRELSMLSDDAQDVIDQESRAQKLLSKLPLAKVVRS